MPACEALPAPPGTGTPCRVCGLDDHDERVQPALHRRCLEQATTKALGRRARTERARAARVQRDHRVLTRAEVLARLIADRTRVPADEAGAPRFDDGMPRRRPGRPRKDRPRPPEADAEPEALTADELDVEDLVRGGGLVSAGLGAEVFGDA